MTVSIDFGQNNFACYGVSGSYCSFKAPQIKGICNAIYHIFYSTISCDQRIYLSIAYHTMNARKGHDKHARLDLIIGLLFLIRGKVNRVRYIYLFKVSVEKVGLDVR